MIGWTCDVTIFVEFGADGMTGFPESAIVASEEFLAGSEEATVP